MIKQEFMVEVDLPESDDTLHTTTKDFLHPYDISEDAADWDADFELNNEAGLKLTVDNKTRLIGFAEKEEDKNEIGAAFIYFFGNFYKAQSFQPIETFYLSKVKVKLYKIGNPADDAHIEIRKLDGTDPDMTPAGLLYSGIFSSDEVGTSADWVEETVSDIRLEAGVNYCILMKSPECVDDENCYFWIYESVSPYPRGQRLESDDSGSSWIESGGDFTFITYGHLPFVPHAKYDKREIYHKDGEWYTSPPDEPYDTCNKGFYSNQFIRVWKVIEGGTDELWFVGRIGNIKKSFDENGNMINLDCTDLTTFLKGVFVNKTYTNMEISLIVKQLFIDYPDTGITAEYVETTNIIISTCTFKDKNIYECIDELAKQSAFDWYVDSTGTLHFFRSSNPTGKGVFDFEGDTVGEYPLGWEILKSDSDPDQTYLEVSDTYSYSGNKSIKFGNTDISNLSWTKMIKQVVIGSEGHVIFEFYSRAKNETFLASPTELLVSLLDENLENRDIFWYDNDSDRVVYRNSLGFETLLYAFNPTYPRTGWYRTVIDFNFTTQKYDISFYAAGETTPLASVTDVSLTVPMNEIGGVSFAADNDINTNRTDEEYYLDNISLIGVRSTETFEEGVNLISAEEEEDSMSIANKISVKGAGSEYSLQFPYATITHALGKIESLKIQENIPIAMGFPMQKFTALLSVNLFPHSIGDISSGDLLLKLLKLSGKEGFPQEEIDSIVIKYSKIQEVLSIGTHLLDGIPEVSLSSNTLNEIGGSGYITKIISGTFYETFESGPGAKWTAFLDKANWNGNTDEFEGSHSGGLWNTAVDVGCYHDLGSVQEGNLVFFLKDVVNYSGTLSRDVDIGIGNEAEGTPYNYIGIRIPRGVTTTTYVQIVKRVADVETSEDLSMTVWDILYYWQKIRFEVRKDETKIYFLSNKDLYDSTKEQDVSFKESVGSDESLRYIILQGPTATGEAGDPPKPIDCVGVVIDLMIWMKDDAVDASEQNERYLKYSGFTKTDWSEYSLLRVRTSWSVPGFMFPGSKAILQVKNGDYWSGAIGSVFPYAKYSGFPVPWNAGNIDFVFDISNFRKENVQEVRIYFPEAHLWALYMQVDLNATYHNVFELIPALKQEFVMEAMLDEKYALSLEGQDYVSTGADPRIEVKTFISPETELFFKEGDSWESPYNSKEACFLSTLMPIPFTCIMNDPEHQHIGISEKKYVDPVLTDEVSNYLIGWHKLEQLSRPRGNISIRSLDINPFILGSLVEFGCDSIATDDLPCYSSLLGTDDAFKMRVRKISIKYDSTGLDCSAELSEYRKDEDKDLVSVIKEIKFEQNKKDKDIGTVEGISIEYWLIDNMTDYYHWVTSSVTLAQEKSDVKYGVASTKGVFTVPVKVGDILGKAYIEKELKTSQMKDWSDKHYLECWFKPDIAFPYSNAYELKLNISAIYRHDLIDDTVFEIKDIKLSSGVWNKVIGDIHEPNLIDTPPGDWTKRTDMDVLPSADEWDIGGVGPGVETDYASISNSILRINTYGQGVANLWYKRDEFSTPALSLDNSTGTTVEIKAKINQCENGGFLYIYLDDGTKRRDVYLYEDKIYTDVGEYEMDTTDKFHIYRITLKESEMRIYVDTILRLTLNTLAGVGSKIWFGDYSASDGDNVDIDIDYVYYSNQGVFEPHVNDDKINIFRIEVTNYDTVNSHIATILIDQISTLRTSPDLAELPVELSP